MCTSINLLLYNIIKIISKLKQLNISIHFISNDTVKKHNAHAEKPMGSKSFIYCMRPKMGIKNMKIVNQ